MARTQLTEPGPVDEDMTGEPEPAELSAKPDLETQFYMIFHLPYSETFMRCAKLDTGAKVNLLNHEVMKDLAAYGLEMEEYKGPKIKPLGELIEPVGQIKIRWSVRRFPKTYTIFLCLIVKVQTVSMLFLGKTQLTKWDFTYETIEFGCPANPLNDRASAYVHPYRAF